MVLMDTLRVRSVRERVLSVKPGATKSEVREILGRPTAQFPAGLGMPEGSFFGSLPERWAYGSKFDWDHCLQKKFPYFLPFRLRLFGPDGDDVAICFDEKGRVSDINVPGDDN